MTQAELSDYVWRRMSVRKYAIGRRRVAELTARAVRQWPVGVLRQCTPEECQIVGQYLQKSLERNAKAEYGMGVILTIVLGALLSELVKILLRWWLESDQNRKAMMELHR
jgi:hypothetical protein